MNQEKLKFFSRLKNSITNISYYNIFIKESLGRAFLYLFLLSLLVSFISTIIISYNTNEGLKYLKEYSKSIPYFEFNNGELNVSGDMPLTYTDPDDNSPIIIDTSGKTDESILNQYDEAVLILKNKLIIKKDSIEKREINFSEIKELNFDKNTLEQFIPNMKLIINIVVIIAVIIFMPIWLFITCSFTALILSLLGLIIKSITKKEISFNDIYIISIYSLTLPLIIKHVLVLNLPFVIPFFWLIYYGIAVFYIYKAISKTGSYDIV